MLATQQRTSDIFESDVLCICRIAVIFIEFLLPIRQITQHSSIIFNYKLSKLPIRQITYDLSDEEIDKFSKLPIRQITFLASSLVINPLSKLPIRQITHQL